jgi:hypothetical protein
MDEDFDERDRYLQNWAIVDSLERQWPVPMRQAAHRHWSDGFFMGTFVGMLMMAALILFLSFSGDWR